MASARRVLLFLGAEDTDAEWELLQSHLPALLAAGAPHERQAIVLERVPLDQASDVAALYARTRGLDGVVWIVVLGESYGPDASVVQLQAAGGVGLADTATPSVLDVVLRHVALTGGILGPVWGHRVLVYERALPPGGRAPDARLVQLAEALRALGGSVSVSRYALDPGASAWERISQRDVWLALVARDVQHALEQPPAEDRTGASAKGAGAEPPPEAPARTVDENVQFTVYRPRRVAPAHWYTLLAFAHLAERRWDGPADAPDPVAEVKREAERRLGEAAADYRATAQDSTQGIPREGEITFLPEVPGLTFNPPRRAFRWTEDVHCEEFRFAADPSLDAATVRGRLTVLLGTIIVADVALVLEVRSEPGTTTDPPVEPSRARPYRNIFPSYSHSDLEIVRQCERYAATLGDRYLRDTVALRAGERWSARLMDLIREADVFQLFWSTNSMRSPFVRQEWEFALELQHRADKDTYFVRPTYWQEPLPADAANDLPPESLRQLHFQRLGVEVGSPRREFEEILRRQKPRATLDVPPLPAERAQSDDVLASDTPVATEPTLAPPRPAWSIVVPALIALCAVGLALAWGFLRALR